MKISLRDGINMVEMYNNGSKIKDIALKYDIDFNNLRYWIKRQKEVVWRGRRVYDLNENYFDIIDTPNKAYFLGFISADGHVPDKSGFRGFTLEISKEDSEIIEKLKSELNFSGPIKSTKSGKYVKIRILSNKIQKSLKGYGLNQNKTKSLILTDLIPDVFFMDYVRGYFDGDGCLYVSKKLRSYCWKIVGNKIFNSKMRSKIENILDLKFYEEQHGTTEYISYLKLNSPTKIKKICEWVYNGNFCLKRKHNKYIEFLELIKIHNSDSTKKLNIDQVKEIKHRLNSGKETHRQISKDYGVSHGPISSINKGNTWKHVE